MTQLHEKIAGLEDRFLPRLEYKHGRWFTIYAFDRPNIVKGGVMEIDAGLAAAVIETTLQRVLFERDHWLEHDLTNIGGVITHTVFGLTWTGSGPTYLDALIAACKEIGK